MLKVAFSGTHATGKTTTMQELKKNEKEWIFFDEITRKIVPILGYDNPWDIVDEIGIAYYESIIMGQWSLIDSIETSLIIKSKVLIFDTSPIDNLAYYYVLRKESELLYEKLLISLCRHYSSLIDVFILFPPKVFPFVKDDMRLRDFQESHHAFIIKLFDKFNIPGKLIHSTSVYARVKEIENIIKDIL